MLSQLNTSTALQLASLSARPSTKTAGVRLRTEPMDPPRTSWTCPTTGLVVPKEIRANLNWRQALRSAAFGDDALQDDLITASRSSFLFWLNAFGWTFHQKIVLPNGQEVPVTGDKAHAPFITWSVQDESALAMIECIAGGQDINFEKSRDMGASWLMLAVADWFFLFQESVSIGAVSRRENLVDKPGDMDSLFEKIRYMHRMLPHWMLPKIRDTFMFLNNLELGSSIAGESTNADVGRGGRKTFYLVDEAAAIRNAEEVEHSLSQNTACQVWASTPHGPSTQFHKRITEKRGFLIQMPWFRHPLKSEGARQIVDESGSIKWTSPWYEIQCQKFSKKTVAQEIDMDHGQAGDMFFDHTELTRHRQDHQTPKIFSGDLIWSEQLDERSKVRKIQEMNPDSLLFLKNHRKNPWRFWTDLIDGRPPQYWTFVFGIDISNGAGSSNSVITVGAIEIGQVVAKWWDAFTSPEELAMVTAMAATWFGGLRPPAFVVYENNGPGGIFGRKLISQLTYPNFYRQKASDTTRNKRRGPRWGWHSTSERKEATFGMYRDALNRDAIINPCKESLDEAADYIYDDTGALIPAKLREEASGGRKLHGDHVVADALCWLGMQEAPKGAPASMSAPRGSYGWRREQQKRRIKRQQRR